MSQPQQCQYVEYKDTSHACSQIATSYNKKKERISESLEK